MTPAVTLGQGLPTDYNGLPIHYRWGHGVKIGEKYTHPTKGFTVDASSENVSKLEKHFRKMKERGVRVPIVKDHHLKADDAMGAVYDVRRKDGWFQPLLGFYGDDSLSTAQKNEISLGIKPHMKDGKGNDYDFALEHVAVTPIPVVNDQRGLLAASRGEDGERPVLTLSAASKTPERSKTMALKPEHRKMMLAHLAGAPGIKDDMDDDALMSRHLEEHGKMKTDIDKYKTYVAQADPHMKQMAMNCSRLAEEAETEKKRADQAEMNLSRAGGPRTDPEVLHERQLRVSTLGEKLIPRYTPANAKKIIETIVGAPGSPNVYTLSREEGQTDCFAAQLIDALIECGPAPKPGDVAGTMVLSRSENQAADSAGGGEREIVNPYTLTKQKVPSVA